MSKASYLLRMDRPRIERIAEGCLRSAIAAHGPITGDWAHSAAKRIVAQLLADIRQTIQREKSGKSDALPTCDWGRASRHHCQKVATNFAVFDREDGWYCDEHFAHDAVRLAQTGANV